MPLPSTLGTFALAAFVLAAMPGPGLLYVISRTLASGRRHGLASCAGAAVGGAVHVVAGMIGVSALIIASATAFAALKFCGGIYLLVLAVQTWRSASDDDRKLTPTIAGASRSFREAVIVEATNPKTAAFFLAFIPQFIDAHGSVAMQFLILGAISVALNTAMDVAAVVAAGALHNVLAARRDTIAWLPRISAGLLGGLGLSVLLVRRPA